MRSSIRVRLLANISRSTAGVIGIWLRLFRSPPLLPPGRGVAVPENEPADRPLKGRVSLSPDTLDGLGRERVPAGREEDGVGVVALCRRAL